MRSARFSGLAWSFALLLALQTVAHAQPDTARRDAEARFREGLSRVQSGDFASARVAFVQAYAVLKSADVLWNLALSELKSNHPLEALEHFEEYVRDARTSEPDRARARRYIDELHGKVGRLAVDAPSGLTLVVDGRVLPQLTPLAVPIDVAPGEHFVEARLGDRSRMMRIQAAAGSVVALRFRADELATGGAAGSSGAASANGSAAANGASTTGPVEPSNEQPRSETSRYVVSGVLFGAGVVAAGTAVAFALSASSSKSDGDALLSAASDNACVRSSSPDCAALDAARRAELRSDGWALGLGITSGALIAGSAAAFFLWPRAGGDRSPSSRGRVRVTPIVGATNGANLTTSF